MVTLRNVINAHIASFLFGKASSCCCCPFVVQNKSTWAVCGVCEQARIMFSSWQMFNLRIEVRVIKRRGGGNEKKKENWCALCAESHDTTVAFSLSLLCFASLFFFFFFFFLFFFFCLFGLQPDRVRTLCIPGSHVEKIEALGLSLANMHRIRHLDLSCNALESTEVESHENTSATHMHLFW